VIKGVRATGPAERSVGTIALTPDKLKLRRDRRMKKVISILVAGILFLSACGNGATEEVETAGEEDEASEQIEEETTEQKEGNNGEAGGNEAEKEDLQLHVTKVDEEDGVTIENSEFYQQVDEFVQENSKFGAPNDFSMLSFSLAEDPLGNPQMLFIGVNRLGAPVTNITFDFSLGNTGGDMVWEDAPVVIDEESTGVLEDNAAVPIFLPVTSEEQIELMNTISQENVVIEFNNFEFEAVDE